MQKSNKYKKQEKDQQTNKSFHELYKMIKR